MSKKILAAVMALAVMLAMTPAVTFVSVNADTGTVTVVVENNSAYNKAAGAPYQGTFKTVKVDYTAGMTEETAVKAAMKVDTSLSAVFASGAYGDYLTEVNGLKSGDATTAKVTGASYDGWMMSVNDWFSNVGATYQTVSAGDTVTLSYSLNGGKDLGADWADTSETLSRLVPDTGAFTQTFSSAATSYTLVVPSTTVSYKLNATATNKNRQVTYKTADGKTYARNASIPVSSGNVTVVVTDYSGKTPVSKDAYFIEVTDNANVTGVTVTPNTLSLTPGKSSTLTAAVATKDNSAVEVTWKSSNEKVAIVSAETGTVAAIAPGKAVITAASKSGMKSASCTVTVAPAKASINKVRALGGGKAKVCWSKVNGASGYQIQVKKAGGSYKTAANVTKGSTVAKTISKLKAGKKYSVRIRAYKKIDSSKIYGAWSSVKTVKVK
jgi:uncharacterized protein YjdB